MRPDWTTAAQQLSITHKPVVTMLAKTTAKRLRLFHTLECLDERGCRIRHTDGGLRSKDPPIIPRAPFQRYRLYTGRRETGSWNIDSQLAKFNGRYYYGFTNGQVDEDTQGQQVRISSSADARTWSQAKSVIGGEEGSRDAYKCVGL